MWQRRIRLSKRMGIDYKNVADANEMGEDASGTNFRYSSWLGDNVANNLDKVTN